MYETSKGIPSTVTKRVSTGVITRSVSDSGICTGVLSYTGKPELILLEEFESGKT